MAILDANEIQFTGSFGNMTAYRLRGSGKIVVRKKGGPTKKQVKTSRKFSHTRLNNSEFDGAVQAAKSIRYTMNLPVLKLADYNIFPQLTKICTRIQKEEKINGKGQRGVLISEHRKLLEGFLLTRKHQFFSVVSNPLDISVDRETKTALIQLPRLIKGINLVLPWRQPLYSFTFCMGVAEDVIHNGSGYYKPERLPIASAHSEWHINGANFLPQTITLQLNMPGALTAAQSLVLTAGIEMGQPDARGEIQSVPYAGSACVLAVR
ncbi:hypothetical protein [uncultured Chitinophaga sp.]|jgi:hypothetical protein|uniref:hypothetical protein n=1 Tax=uncultured Chitinophaga sp. TaxID=339340 RepID=UPI00260BDCD1|nr:hypothetical protein [uncultured Chitinophaga sp.]